MPTAVKLAPPTAPSPYDDLGGPPTAAPEVSPYESVGALPTANPSAVSSLSKVPKNDAELRDLLVTGAATFKGMGGPANIPKALSDTLYTSIAKYAQANPKSTLAKSTLELAHKHAPPGLSFPSVK